MEANTSGALKRRVHDFWNAQACDSQVAQSAKFTRDYFEEIETFRYQDQPFIHSFAQFTRFHGKRVLEVGVGAGTDFIQWLRAGAIASGVDLTEEALEHVKHRIQVYGLPEPQALEVADAESLPFASDTFDLGYSFGVLHHTPETEKGLRELVRVIRPGGELKVMLYNRRSVYIFNRWVRFALLRGRPWRTLQWILANKVENPGTKGFSRGELAKMLGALPLQNVRILTEVTSADSLSSSAFVPLNLLYRCVLRLAGSYYPWDTVRYAARINDPGKAGRSVEAIALQPEGSRNSQHERREANGRSAGRPGPQEPRMQMEPANPSSSEHNGRAAAGRDVPRSVPWQPIFAGNPLGFFHCISAEKRCSDAG